MAILFNGWNRLKHCQYPFDRRLPVKSGGWSEKKTFKDYMSLNMYIAKGQGRITTREQNFDCN